MSNYYFFFIKGHAFLPFLPGIFGRMPGFYLVRCRTFCYLYKCSWTSFWDAVRWSRDSFVIVDVALNASVAQMNPLELILPKGEKNSCSVLSWSWESWDFPVCSQPSGCFFPQPGAIHSCAHTDGCPLYRSVYKSSLFGALSWELWLISSI